MKLRSAQFVLLVLLFSTLSLSEVSSMRLAREIIGMSSGASTRPAARAQRAMKPAAAPARPLAAHARPAAATRIAWTMRAPAAQAAAIQAVTARPVCNLA